MASILDSLLGQNNNSDSGPATNDATANLLGGLMGGGNLPAQLQAARQQQGLLGLSMGLLQGSGPSRYPVPFGSALGSGLAGMAQLQGQLPTQSLQAAQTQNQLTDSQLKQLQGLGLITGMKLQQQEADAIIRANSGGGGASGAPAADVTGRTGPVGNFPTTSPGQSGSGQPGSAGPPQGGDGLLTPAQVKTTAMKYFPESEDLANLAGAIGWAESSPHGNPFSYNGNGENSYGLTQINADAWGPNAQKTYGNVDEAFRQMRDIYDRSGGFGPWTTYTKGAYKEFLPLFADAKPEPLGNGPAGTAPVAPASGAIDMAVGDSVAKGLNQYGKLSGSYIDDKSMQGADTKDAAGSRNPQEVLDNIATNLNNDPGYYRGKTVLLSTGTMNDPQNQMFNVIPQQIEAIKRAGGNVVLAGTDTGQFADRNAALGQIAQAAKIPFAGPLPTNNIHPGPDGYKTYLGNAIAMAPAGTAQQMAPIAGPPTLPGQPPIRLAQNGPIAPGMLAQAAGAPPAPGPQGAPTGILPQAAGAPQAPAAPQGPGILPQVAAGTPPQAPPQMAPPQMAPPQGGSPFMAYQPQAPGNMLPPGVSMQQVQAARTAAGLAALRGAQVDPYTAKLATYPIEAALAAQNAQTEATVKTGSAGPTAYNTSMGTGMGGSQFELVDATIQTPRGPMDIKVPKSVYLAGPQAIMAYATGGPAAATQFMGNGAAGSPPSGMNAPGGATAAPTGNPATAAQNGPAPMVGKLGVNPGYQTALEGLTKEDTALMTGSENREGYIPSAQKAAEMLNTAQIIKDLLPEVKTGSGATYQAAAAKILSALGVSDQALTDFLGTNPMASDILQKKFLEQSSAAVRLLGAREPGSVITLFGKAYPGLTTQKNAIDLMENVLIMQAKWSQARLAGASAYRNEQMQNLRNGGNYSSLSDFEAGIPSGKLNASYYLKAAEAMSGLGNKAWQGLNTQQQAAVYNAIPAGTQYMRPDGQLDTKR